MKKEFFEPEVEVLLFDIEDIVTTSDDTNTGTNNLEGEYQGGFDN